MQVVDDQPVERPALQLRLRQYRFDGAVQQQPLTVGRQRQAGGQLGQQPREFGSTRRRQIQRAALKHLAQQPRERGVGHPRIARAALHDEHLPARGKLGQ